ncbi:sigma factor-like helix-turn-helix DNA-binding protein [Actinotalea sp. AC32]|nr:sigma factor-like helix-turn-helix DNA-binding protein [Actinotalea sp. AC32]
MRGGSPGGGGASAATRARVEEAIEDLWRSDWSRLVALVIGQFARPDLAEDAVADAFASAARTWPRDGVPANPAAWVLTAARRRVLDALRSEAVHRRKEPLMVVDEGLRHDAAAAVDPGAHLADETLRLLFSCCHPALAPEARVALTLRFVVGLDVPEIARLLLVQETTLQARITRAKKRLAAAGIPFAPPPPERMAERLGTVAVVLYLLFTAGYQPTRGAAALRVDVAERAIALTRALDAAVPGSDLVHALLALMLLQHSRRDARTDDDGRLVLLADQDRTRWHADEVVEALGLLDGVRPGAGQAEEYRLQALVAAEHARASSAADTRWDVVADLYARLERLTGSAVVRLARAVAVAEARGAEAGLALLDGLDDALPRSHRVPVVRGELLARTGAVAQAHAELSRALDRVTNEAEREHLRRRLTELDAGAGLDADAG